MHSPPAHSPQIPSHLFFQYNDQLGPPFHILVDTNFINFSIQHKLDVVQSMMDCLYAKCECNGFPSHPVHTHTHTHTPRVLLHTHTHSLTGVPCITDCVMGELEKLGSKFRVAQQIAKDVRFERLPCMHKGTYADDCLVNRVTQVFAWI